MKTTSDETGSLQSSFSSSPGILLEIDLSQQLRFSPWDQTILILLLVFRFVQRPSAISKTGIASNAFRSASLSGPKTPEENFRKYLAVCGTSGLRKQERLSASPGTLLWPREYSIRHKSQLNLRSENMTKEFWLI
jgi:hypothetical protein